MVRTLELSEDLYQALERVATSNGTTPQGWIAANLPKNGAPPPPTDAEEPKKKLTLIERFGDYIGFIKSDGTDRLSENTGEKFTDYLEQKHAEGRL